MSKEESKRKAAELAGKKDISSDDLMHEVNHITMVHIANLTRKASAERSFGKLKLITIVELRSSIDQDHLNNMAMLCIESDMAVK